MIWERIWKLLMGCIFVFCCCPLPLPIIQTCFCFDFLLFFRTCPQIDLKVFNSFNTRVNGAFFYSQKEFYNMSNHAFVRKIILYLFELLYSIHKTHHKHKLEKVLIFLFGKSQCCICATHPTNVGWGQDWLRGDSLYCVY